MIAGQTLSVVDSSCCLQVTAGAQGNSVSGASQGSDYTLESTQDARGVVRSTANVTLGGDTDGFVRGGIQADGNALQAGAYNADLLIDAGQHQSGRVEASSHIGDTEARMIGGARVGVGANGNIMSLNGENARLDGQVGQSSSAAVTSENFVGVRYAPGRAEYHSQTTANSFTAISTGVSDQNLAVGQRSTGTHVQAGTSANAANSWNLAARSNAAANRAHFANAGGAQVIRTDQGNSSTVRGATVVTSYQFGAIESVANATANEVIGFNNDIHFQMDNTQLNTGGVSAEASFSGHQGYDVLMGANAAGNVVSGQVCSTCNGYMWVNNNQTNSGNVSATVNGSATGGARTVISGANAVGNSASFYVTRPGN